MYGASSVGSGSLGQIYNTAYGDPYPSILSQISGCLSLIDLASNSVIRQVCSKDESAKNKLINDFDVQEKKLKELTDSLFTSRTQGKKPAMSAWGMNQDNLINRCETLKGIFERNSNNNLFINQGWHFKEICRMLDVLKDELIICSGLFSTNSNYVKRT